VNSCTYTLILWDARDDRNESAVMSGCMLLRPSKRMKTMRKSNRKNWAEMSVSEKAAAIAGSASALARRQRKRQAEKKKPR
jgi:hypothetical protein